MVEYLINEYLGRKHTYYSLKNQYNNLLSNTSDILKNLNSKQNILNFRNYIFQKKCLKRLTNFFKEELNNPPKNIIYDCDFHSKKTIENIKKFDNKIIESFCNEKFINRSQLNYYENYFNKRINQYNRLIKKYSKSYIRYIKKMERYILFFKKNFKCEKQIHDLDLNK